MIHPPSWFSLLMARTTYDFEVDDIYYKKTSFGTSVSVTRGSNKYTGSVTIPSQVSYSGTTYSVTSIGGGAFYGCSGLTSVTIPNSVTSIGYEAFRGCRGLTSVTIPSSVTKIGYAAFCGCRGLTSVTIPSSVTEVGWAAFSGCSGLTSVTIPNSVTAIGRAAFAGCSGLTSVTIPNSVTSIGQSAFNGCSGLTSVTIPKSVTKIGRWAFSDCINLESINVESGNKVFDSRNDCNAIIETATNTLIAGCKNTIIPNSVTSIGWAAFDGCSGLTSVTIPNYVNEIGEYAFSGCTGLASLYCNAEVPPTCGDEVFKDVNKAECILYVPENSISAYQAADQWKDFRKICSATK